MNMPENNIDFEEMPEKSPKKSKSFYIALAICVVAVSAAGWSTYESVKDFVNPSKVELQEQNRSKSRDKNSVQKGKSNSSINETSKNSILEIDQEQKSRSNRELIPYGNEKKPVEPAATPEEEVQAVAAVQSEPLIIYPAGNTVIKEFSNGKPVYSKTLGDWRAHNGADFKAEPGSIVKSITSGTVKDIYSDPSYGTTIVIEHDPKFISYYCGLGETVLIEKGKRVKSGQEIGSIKAVPCEVMDEPHLHLMIHKNGQFIDPMLILENENETQ